MRKIKGIYIGVLLLLNSVYLGVELYKNSVRNRWAGDEGIAEEAFHQLQQLRGVTDVLNVLLVFVILGGALGLIVWKKKEQLKIQVVFTLGISVLFYIGAFAAGNLTGAPLGNLMQQIYTMNTAVALILVFVLISAYRRNDEKEAGL